MIWDFIQVFTKVRSSQKLYADDNIDKLNRSVSVILLIIAAIFIGSKNFGVPIICLQPNIQISPISLDYVNALCWVQDTLRLKEFFSTAIRNEKSMNRTNYYPWLSLIAILLAFLFYVPYILWKLLIRKNTYQNVPVDINSIVDLLRNSSLQQTDDFAKNIVTAGSYLDRCFSLNNFNDSYLDEHEDFSKCFEVEKFENKEPKIYNDRLKKRKLKFFFVPLFLKYLFVKLIYCIISISIFFILEYLLQFKESFFFYGPNMIEKFTSSNDTTNELVSYKYFPYHVICDIKYQGDMRHVQRHTFHCSLPASVYNEKVFFILWCWFIVLIIFNLYSLIKWLLKLTFRKIILRNMLIWPFRYDYHIDKYLDSFVYEYLSTEGFLVLMLIKANTQDWYCRSLVRVLWKLYINRTKCDFEQITTPISSEIIQKYDNSKELLNEPSTLKLKTRIEYNYEPSDGKNATPIKANSLKLKNESTKDCKNNFKLNEQFIVFKNDEDMV